MNILINYLSAKSGGAITYMRSITPPLMKRFEASGSHRLILLFHEEQRRFLPGLPEESCRIVNGPRPSGLDRIWWERRNLAGLAQNEHAGVIFFPYQVAPRLKGIRQVLMLRNMEPFHYGDYPYSIKSALRNRLLGAKTMDCLRRAEMIIAVSDYSRDFLIKAHVAPAANIRRIYHGRDHRFSPHCMPEDDFRLASIDIKGDFIFTCGSLLPYRRHEDVIGAFERLLPAQKAGLRLVIAGSGTDRRYNRLITRKVCESGFAKYIHLLGHVSGEMMQTLYRKCRVCVIASEVEACPNIAIEAMASGSIIAAAYAPPMPEMFSHAATYFGPRDIGGLASTISRCLADEDLRRRLSSEALRRAAEFSWDRCAHETFDALVNC